MLSSQAERTEPLRIYGPPPLKDFMHSMLKTLPMYIDYKLVIEELKEGGVLHRGAGYEISCFPVSHRRSCLAYSLNEYERPGIFFPERAEAYGVQKGPLWGQLQGGHAVTLSNGTTITPEMVMGERRRGRKVSFVTDTIPLAGLSKFVSEADLFLCGAMYRDSQAAESLQRGHLTATQAAEIARDGAVVQLGLIHKNPVYSNGTLKQMLNEAERTFPNTFLAEDLQTIVIPNPA